MFARSGNTFESASMRSSSRRVTFCVMAFDMGRAQRAMVSFVRIFFCSCRMP